MKKKFYFIILTQGYLEYLKNYENKVSEKIGKPFIGIILDVNGNSYFAPLSSPKKKHKNMKDKIDFFKIDGGKLGIINLNNMIPVIDNDKCRSKIDLQALSKSSDEKDKKYFR